ncbi:MAG: PHP domain-containing protein [Gemmatimonadetes bacterium]|nr:PHP domain-containing protein [Gemmatimonadota bacterium]MBK6841738.1 PHP domain-containing protein [Gemmatimonadota bacterium]MBK9978598.1 PHP domain-containing protein [Gemmatimonadota bacterium]
MSGPAATPLPGDALPARVDLHMHSTASDGSQSPEGVVAAALASGVSAIALTDHDTVAGVQPAREAAAGSSLRVIAGVELSAYQGDEETHLLGLHLTDVLGIERELEAFRDARRDRGEQMVERLNAIGVKITFQDVLDAAGGGAIGRPHVAKALVENGWARDNRDAFDRYLGAGRPAYLDKRRLSLRDAIAMVHGCGGIAVLAHPGGEGTLTRLTALKAMGLDGVEVLHPSHSGEDRKRLLAIAEHLDLVPSGGSDSHGATAGPRVIGALPVPLAWLERQDARVELRRAGVAA